MKLLPAEEYLSHLRAESARFREVLGSADLSADVPACPEWSGADLLWHLTEVQWFWSQIVVRRPSGPNELPSRPARASTSEAALAAFDEWSGVLLDALSSADPDDEAWTWSTDHSVGFILRRQAHEALIHRLDAEQTAHCLTPLDATLAGDGIAELIALRSAGPNFGSVPHYLRITATDIGRDYWVEIGHEPGENGEQEAVVLLEAAPDAEPDAVLDGTAADLDAWLWRRIDDDTLAVHGSRDFFDHVRAVLHRPV